MDSSTDSDDDLSSNVSSSSSDISFAEDLCVASIALTHRVDRMIAVRMNWHRYVESFLHENLFHVKYRMSIASFNKLLNLLRPALQLNHKYAVMTGMEPICCEIMLHCMIRYLAGGSYHDVRATVFISKPSFYHLVWHTIDCINSCQALDVKLPGIDELNCVREGFKRISADGIMNGCVGALDGYLLRITAPSFAECQNVAAYFSGHYCTYGVNVQAMCDADCRFLFFALAAPGKTNDVVALRKTSLSAWLESLPPGFFVASDCTYSITEHLVAPYSGPQRFSEWCDNFNFFLSQLRIRIEMAFGLLVTKWRILHTPINVKLTNLKKLLNAVCRLHNFCIENREGTTRISRVYRVPQQYHHPHEPTELGYIPTDAPCVVSREGTSHLRELLARRVSNNNLSRPLSASTKRALERRRSSLYE